MQSYEAKGIRLVIEDDGTITTYRLDSTQEEWYIQERIKYVSVIERHKGYIEATRENGLTDLFCVATARRSATVSKGVAIQYEEIGGEIFIIFTDVRHKIILDGVGRLISSTDNSVEDAWIEFRGAGPVLCRKGVTSKNIRISTLEGFHIAFNFNV